MEKLYNFFAKLFKFIPGGFFGLLCVLISGLILSFSISQFPGYSMILYDVSVLGIGPGLSAPIFNIGLIFIGITAIPFFIYLGDLLHREHRNSLLSNRAIFLSLVCCTSLSLISFFPVINFLMAVIHASLALVFFVTGMLALLSYSILMLRENSFANIHSYSGFIISGFIVFYIIVRWSIVEWIVFFAIGFWITQISIYTLYKHYK